MDSKPYYGFDIQISGIRSTDAGLQRALTKTVCSPDCLLKPCICITRLEALLLSFRWGFIDLDISDESSDRQSQIHVLIENKSNARAHSSVQTVQLYNSQHIFIALFRITSECLCVHSNRQHRLSDLQKVHTKAGHSSWGIKMPFRGP